MSKQKKKRQILGRPGRLRLAWKKLTLSKDEYCRRCGGGNVIWSAQSPLWNYVMRENDINGPIKYADLVCVPCFMELAVEKGLPAIGWRLTLVPEPEGLIYQTPSGRYWDHERFLWVEPGKEN